MNINSILLRPCRSVSASNLENFDFGFKLLFEIGKTNLIDKIINENVIRGAYKSEHFSTIF